MRLTKIWNALAIAGVLLFLATGLHAQTQTNVTATIQDPLGIPYANGTYSIQLIPSGTNPTVNGNSIGGAFNGRLDQNGSFNVSLWPNGSIVPGGSQWAFTICIPGGVAPPLGTGGQCTPPTAVTISGASQSLSATLSAVAPRLTTITVGGSVTSVSGTSPIVATPNPITGAGAISCPGCAIIPPGTCSVSGGVAFNNGTPGQLACQSDFTFASTPSEGLTVPGTVNVIGTVANGSGRISFTGDVAGAVTLQALDNGGSPNSIALPGSDPVGTQMLVGIQGNPTVWTYQAIPSGTPSFSAITSGTNTAAAMVLGTGSSLTTSGTGTISSTTGFNATANGVNPGEMAFVGNTVNPALGASQFAIFGPPLAAFTSWSAQFGSAIPANNHLLTCVVTGTNCLISDGGAVPSGTVTSIATTSPITGGTITTTGTIGCAACVNSAAALTSNAVMIGGGLQASSTISADSTTTHALFATAGAPAFRAIVSGDLPAATLAFPVTGTGIVSGAIPCGTSTTTLTMGALLASGGVVLGGGAGACPTTSTQLTFSAPTLTVGLAGTSSGILALAGSASGSATFTAPATAGTSTNAVNSSNIITGPLGAVGTPTFGTVAGTNTGTGMFFSGASTSAIMAQGGTAIAMFSPSGPILGNTMVYQIGSGGCCNSGGGDTGLSRPAAAIWAAGNGTAGSTVGSFKASGYQSLGTKFAASGCSVASLVGGATAGKFTVTAGACAGVTVTMGDTDTGPNGWACHASDLTTPANLWSAKSGGSTTTAILAGTAVGTDTIEFACVGY